MWYPWRFATIQASTASYRHSFTFTYWVNFTRVANQMNVFVFFPKYFKKNGGTDHEIDLLSSSFLLYRLLIFQRLALYLCLSFSRYLCYIFLSCCFTGELFSTWRQTNSAGYRIRWWKIFPQSFECHVSRLQYLPEYKALIFSLLPFK
jgi:hypothetical protein